jgi:hypothetical protein
MHEADWQGAPLCQRAVCIILGDEALGKFRYMLRGAVGAPGALRPQGTQLREHVRLNQPAFVLSKQVLHQSAKCCC